MPPSKDTIKQILTEMNPWWSAGKVSTSLAGIQRKRYFQQLEESLNVPEIIVLTGMRRTGKTTIMYQLIQYLIQRHVKPNRILYVQFDHPLLKTLDVSDLIRGHRVDCGMSKKEALYIFFDEIHFLQDWAQWIKTIYEQKQVKMFISGSSKVLLIPKAMTHLTGRYLTYQIWPLFFREFLDFRNSLPEAGDEHRYVSLVEEYLSIGGFPRVVLEENVELRGRLLREYFDSILFKDIAAIHEIRDIRTLRELAAFLITSSGKPISFNKLKNTFKLSLDTIREYISYIEESHLIEELPVSSPSRNERVYNPKKYYVLDPGMRFALTGEKEIGSRAETALLLQLKQLGYDIGYWKKIYEVDFILQRKPLIALESKYKDDLTSKDLKSLGKWLKTENDGKAVIVTRNLEEIIEEDGYIITAVPLWKVLLDPTVITGEK